VIFSGRSLNTYVREGVGLGGCERGGGMGGDLDVWVPSGVGNIIAPVGEGDFVGGGRVGV